LPHNSSANHHNLYLAIRHTHPKETMPENHKRKNAKKAGQRLNSLKIWRLLRFE